LGDDVRTAVQTHAVLEAANDTIPRGMKNHEFAATFNVIQNGLALKLALELARIFDLSKGSPPEEQDKASVPVLAALLGRPDVQLGLELEAESNWFPGVAHIGTIGPEGPSGATEADLRSLEENSRSEDRDSCRAAIAKFLGVVGRMASPEGAALERFRQFRNQRLAHSLLHQAPDQPPRYADLFLLLGLAKDAARHLPWLSKDRTEISTMLQRLIARTLTAITAAFSKRSSARSNKKHAHPPSPPAASPRHWRRERSRSPRLADHPE
jgi:hypothetical protein